MQYVYILTNKSRRTLYIATTRNLEGRVFQHKAHEKIDSFSQKYGLDKLVYYEEHSRVMDGVLREKQMKKWNRAWKIKLIESMNPHWEDLASDWFVGFPPARE